MSVHHKDLNKQQIKAVETDGNVLITACPGSGKTRVITHKLAYELQRMSDSKRLIIALTYTNRAADEIKRRVEKFDISTSNLWTGTIHSFCLEWILKPYMGYLSELKNGFAIIDEFESDELISELKDKHCIYKYASIKRVYNLDGGFNTNDSRYLPLIQEYKKTIHREKKIDFDDILYYSYKLIIKFPIISVRLSNLFSLLCVDEYQDTQELQYSILAEIVKANDNKTKIFFVGDICQAIYGSIGGIAKNKNEISKQFGGITIEPLELSGNYRSNQRVIDYYSNYQVENLRIAAVSSIAVNRGVISYDTETHLDNIHEVVSKLIRNTINKGIAPSEICVMAPQWWMILPMGRKLKSLLPDIDFDAFGLSPFRRIRDNIWYKVIKLFLSKPYNSNYTIRYQWALELLIALDEIIPDFLLGISNRKRFLLRAINHFSTNQKDSLLFIEEALKYFLWVFSISIENFPLLNDKREIFIRVVARELEKEEFDYASDVNTLIRVFNTKSGVVVSTCHGVKGEEYETVIAFGLLDGYIPNWNDEDKMAANKLLYVMCSRAKNNLYLFSEQGHKTKLGPRAPTGVLAGIPYSYD